MFGFHKEIAAKNLFPYSLWWAERHAAGGRRSAQAVVPRVLELTGARRVLDVGCGLGEWLQVFREAGVDEVHGVDGEYMPLEAGGSPPPRFTALDLSRPFDLDREFDLAVSLEVAEHLPASSAASFVESLTAHAPVVLFSAAIPYQGGEGHVNERWPDYWAELFAARGYVPVDCLRDEVWTDERVEWWYAQNLLVYVAEDRLPEYPALAEARAARPHPPRHLVHPDLYQGTATRWHRSFSNLYWRLYAGFWAACGRLLARVRGAPRRQRLRGTLGR